MDKLTAVNAARQEAARQVRQLRIRDFHDQLVDAGVYRAFLLYENGQFTLSHPKLLQPLQHFCELSQDFANHEGVFIGREDGLDAVFWAFVHDTRRGLAQGGLRFHPYASLADVLVDGLRLSQGMTRKNALAGLSWGGGKGIMTLPGQYTHPSQFGAGPERRAYFEAYGRFVASLGGIYYTAEDVGTSTADMEALLSQNRFTTCIPASLGGSGNPSPFTARGVLRAMQAAWQALSGSDSLMGVHVAVQGTGNVGAPLIRYLDDLGAIVHVADVNTASLDALLAERPRLIRVDDPGAIFDVDAAIFAPCAIGAQVNVDTIPRLKVRLICGAANNILREPEADAERLRARGIGFVPDYVCNRMGIVNCADEWQGYLAEDVRLAAERVFPDTLRVFKYARSRNATTTEAANALADMAASELHPMLGHRGRRLIDHLRQQHWEKWRPDYTPQAPVSSLEPAFVAVLDEPPLRVRWEREGHFLATQRHTLAATPISTAARPDLASCLSALLLDVKARALTQIYGERPRRVLGSEHGGLALQIAVEQTLPYEREDIGRAEFVSLCRDAYHRHDAAVREQLQQLGVGFDHRYWISPMEGEAQEAIEAAYDFLKRADLLFTLDAIAHHCPRCESIRVASDVVRAHHRVETGYRLNLQAADGTVLPLDLLFPEFLPGAVGIAVHPESAYARLVGDHVREPWSGRELPIVASALVESDLELIAPLSLKRHERIAQEQGLHTRAQIFDEKGRISLPNAPALNREAAREQILIALNGHWETLQGSWSVESPHCSRCEALVIPRYGDQLFVRVQSALDDLQSLIERDEVQFSHPLWKQRSLDMLGDFSLWCISRQYWWGNERPDQPGEVLSTWFTMAIWSLFGAGWPKNPKPRPIDEVFVDAELLTRWIIPSQLASLILTGQPVFRHVHVHGTLHVMERTLKPLPGVAGNAPDEERFVHHHVRRPMRYRLGNVIEPGTLIRRFGADALRLGYALSLESHAPDMVLLSEDRLRLARHTLRRLISKVTGLYHLSPTAGEDAPRALDHWMLYAAAPVQTQMQQHYLVNNLAAVAERLVQQAEELVRYINTVAERRHAGGLGAARSTVAQLLAGMERDFGPLCPFVFARLAAWTAQRVMPSEPLASASDPLCHLLEALLQEPESMEPLEAPLLAQVPELERFFGTAWGLIY
ncbi:MAG: class I tRNA ligase family protein [Candidatus Sericytochromatia bacterium]